MLSITNVRAIPARTILQDPERVPHRPGVYAALFPNGEKLLNRWGYQPAQGEQRARVAGMPVLYIGATSSLGLSKRLRTHMRRDCRSSTFRWTLASLLDLEEPFVGVDRMRASSIRLADEQRVTAWMAEEIVFAFAEHAHPMRAEAELITTISCPLNINQRGFHAFTHVLKQRRLALRNRLLEAAR